MAVEQGKDRPIEELEKEKSWWWAAEKRRSKRLDYLRKGIYKQGPIGRTYSPGLTGAGVQAPPKLVHQSTE